MKRVSRSPSPTEYTVPKQAAVAPREEPPADLPVTTASQAPSLSAGQIQCLLRLEALIPDSRNARHTSPMTITLDYKQIQSPEPAQDVEKALSHLIETKRIFAFAPGVKPGTFHIRLKATDEQTAEGVKALAAQWTVSPLSEEEEQWRNQLVQNMEKTPGQAIVVPYPRISDPTMGAESAYRVLDSMLLKREISNWTYGIEYKLILKKEPTDTFSKRLLTSKWRNEA